MPDDLQATLLRLVPEDGSAIGNQSRKEKFLSAATRASDAEEKIGDDLGIESLKVMGLD